MLLLSCGVFRALADEEVPIGTGEASGLNVDTPEGVQALYGRIHAAAGRVCSECDPVRRQAVTSCAEKAESDAIQKLNLPQLTAYYR